MTTLAAPNLDFGEIPFEATEEALERLRALPQAALDGALEAARRWARSAPVTSARLFLVVDPEDPTWREAVIEFTLAADMKRAMEMWGELSDAVTAATKRLSRRTKTVIDEGFNVHVLWDLGAD